MSNNHTNQPNTTPASNNGQQPTEHDFGLRYLNLCLGGGGKEFAQVQKQEETLRGSHPHVHTKVIDTDPEGLADFYAQDALLLTEVPGADLAREMEENPEQFPGSAKFGEPGKFWKALGATEELNAGLQTARVLIHLVLLFFFNRYYARVVSFILEPIRDLQRFIKMANVAENGYKPTTQRLRLMITLVFSSAGGTGSGLGILLADILHTLLRNFWGIAGYETTAHIILPGPMTHRAIEPQTLMANTYATFKEILLRYTKRLSTIRLGSLEVLRIYRPFKQLYAYEETNLRGRIFTSRRQVVQVISVVWQLMNFGPEGAQYRARLADYFIDIPNLLSAAGACIWEFPVTRIIVDFGYRLGRQSALTLIQPLPEAEARQKGQQQLVDFLHKHPEFRDLPKFQNDRSGKPIRVNLDGLAKGERRLIPRALERFAQRQVPAWKTSLDELLIASVSQFDQVLAIEVEQVLNRKGGFSIALAFLEGLETLLQEQRDQQQVRTEQAWRTKQRGETRMETRQNSAWWARLSLTPRKDYVADHQSLLESQVEVLRTTARMQLIQHLLAQIENHRTACGDWRLALSTLAERMETERVFFLQKYQAEQSIAVESVVSDAEIDRMYENKLLPSLREALASLKFKWALEKHQFVLEYLQDDGDESVADQAVLSPQGIQRHAEYCQKFWQSIRNETVENLLKQKGLSPEQVLQDLKIKAAPLVSINEVKQLPAEKPLLILASETGDFFKGLVGTTGLSTVATGNKHRLSLLYTIHGLHPFKLMKAESWRQAYEQAIAQGRALHVYPETDFLEEPEAPSSTAAQVAKDIAEPELGDKEEAHVTV